MKPSVSLLCLALLLPLPAAASPVFQAVGLFGDLAVVDTTHLLSTATFIKPDPGFTNASLVTGLARSPATGVLWVAGTDFVNSYIGEVDFSSGAVSTLVTLDGEVVVDLAFDGAGSLYALSDNGSGSHPHSLLKIDTGTGALSVAKVLDAHGGTSDFGQVGAIGWNPADQSIYYADLDSSRHLFIDKLSGASFTQSPAFSSALALGPMALSFTGGKLWLSTNFSIYSTDPTNFAAGLTKEGRPAFATADGSFAFSISGMFPAALGCTPSPTSACLYNRFKRRSPTTPGRRMARAQVASFWRAARASSGHSLTRRTSNSSSRCSMLARRPSTSGGSLAGD